MNFIVAIAIFIFRLWMITTTTTKAKKIKKKKIKPRAGGFRRNNFCKELENMLNPPKEIRTKVWYMMRVSELETELNRKRTSKKRAAAIREVLIDYNNEIAAIDAARASSSK